MRYNGKDEFPDERELHLSAAYHEMPERSEKYGSLELSIRMLNINHGHNVEIINRSETLRGYTIFIQRVRAGTDAGLDRDEAVAEAVKYCEDHAILQPFLTNHSSEVNNMLTTEFDIDVAKEVWQEEAYEDGHDDGYAEAEEKWSNIVALQKEENAKQAEEIARQAEENARHADEIARLEALIKQLYAKSSE